MENIYILVHRIDSANKKEYNKIYNAIKDNIETYSTSINIVEETSTIYYQATAKQNFKFIKTIKSYLRKDDSLTITNLSEEQVIFWDNDRFKQSKKYSYLLHH